MRPLSLSKVNSVKNLLHQGKSIWQIEKELNIPHPFIIKIHQQDKKNIPAPKMGRPIKVSKRTRCALMIKFLINDFDNKNQ
ncbi:hypothetical protein FBU30_005078, partial [Linnemannia zychae]